MPNAAEFTLLLLSQFAGGPGPVENNLVRFGLPAILWGALLLVAGSRQRTQNLPREKLLVWGFGLGLARELFMFVQVAERLLGRRNHLEGVLHQPIEHALAMASIVVVAAAFLRYILDDERLPRRYLQAGLGATAAGFGFVSWAWPRQLAANPEILFHQTWEAWLFHLPLSVLILVASFCLGTKRGWLRNVVVLALAFFFLGEVLVLTNYATDRAYDHIVCPIANTFHILAIPLLGYVYLHEQSIEKRRAERALEAHRNHLEDLVGERTAELAHLHRASSMLASALDADEIYEQIVQQSIELVNCQAACVLLWSEERQQTDLVSCCGMGDQGREIVHAQPGPAALLADLHADHQTIAIADAAADSRVPTSWIEELDVKALLCLLIKSTQDALGFLLLMDLETTRSWQTEEIELVESFVNRAAVSLVNAKLHKQLEWAAALEERQRIAADMHDGLGQTLSLLGLHIDQVTELVVEGSVHQSTQELYGIRDLIEQASQDVRRSITSLQEVPRPRRSLQEQLAELAEQLPSDQKLRIHSSFEAPRPLYLLPKLEEQILPIVQEALLNARYHAQAQQVWLVLEHQVSQIKVTIQDDGRGFDPNTVHRNSAGHFGLSIMRARAERIGAWLEVNSTPGHGTRVTLAWAQNGHPAQVPSTFQPSLATEAER